MHVRHVAGAFIILGIGLSCYASIGSVVFIY